MCYIWKYIQYLFKSKHRRGFGIHSPYVYYLMTMVIENKHPYYRFSQVETLRKILKKSSKKLLISKDGGDGQEEVTLSSLVGENTFSPSYDQLLFRLSKFFHPQNIVEFGSSIGISTIYLATPDSRTKVYAGEKEKAVSELLKMNLKKTGVENVQVYEDYNMQLENVKEDQIGLVYFGRKCMPKDIEKLYDEVKKKLVTTSVVIISDIHKDKGKEMVWNKIRESANVRVDLDLFFYGILIYNNDLQRESYNLYYTPPLFL